MSDNVDDLKQQIEACKLALTILKSIQTRQSRVVPLSIRIVQAVDRSGLEGISLLALLRQFDLPERWSIRRHVGQLVQDNKLVERENRLYPHQAVGKPGEATAETRAIDGMGGRPPRS